MTDINSTLPRRQVSPAAITELDPRTIELIELMFFAYRDFVSDPDAILADYEFGRAHHRVIHFVGRNPGMRVAELLRILRITKQSLGRVLRELVEQGFVRQRAGDSDRRQRLLYLTDRGHALHARLIAPQSRRIEAALDGLGPEAPRLFRAALTAMIDDRDREHVAAIIAGANENR